MDIHVRPVLTLWFSDFNGCRALGAVNSFICSAIFKIICVRLTSNIEKESQNSIPIQVIPPNKVRSYWNEAKNEIKANPSDEGEILVARRTNRQIEVKHSKQTQTTQENAMKSTLFLSQSVWSDWKFSYCQHSTSTHTAHFCCCRFLYFADVQMCILNCFCKKAINCYVCASAYRHRHGETAQLRQREREREFKSKQIHCTSISVLWFANHCSYRHAFDL